jgi:hypothetical protein
MFIEIRNNTHRVEGSYIHSNLQQYTNSGVFVFTM